MSEKKDMTQKDISRAELVRLRREKDSRTRVERARKESTRSVPVTSRTRTGESTQSKRRTQQTGNAGTRSARRRFQNALLPVAPDAEMRGISIARPNLGRRLPAFLVVALLATAIYFAFNTPQLRVTQAQVVGNQMLTPAEINTALDIAGQPTFLLVPSELEKRLRLQFPSCLPRGWMLVCPILFPYRWSSASPSSAGSREKGTPGFQRRALLSALTEICQD